MVARRLTAVLALLLTGCAAPVGVNRVGMDRAYEQINATALTGNLSSETLLILARYGLKSDAPDIAVRELHKLACEETRRDVLYALAEISYAAGKKYESFTWTGNTTGRPGRQVARGYYGAAAIYAYLYLFDPSVGTAPDPFDRRFRTACDFYNRGLAKALRDDDRVDLKARTLQLPMGEVTVDVTRPGFPWSEKHIHEFVAADIYTVRGLSTRAREPGLGVPLIGLPDRTAFGDKWPAYYSQGSKVPATAFLRVNGSIRDMNSAKMKATLELICPYNQTTTKINGRTIPLESDLTAPFAYGLNNAVVWKAGLSQFLSGQQMIKTAVYLPQPYEPGKIPVVFVHGTLSSPVGWAEMFNTLLADSALNEKYQFWYFIYNSGQPIPYSAMLLREGIDKLVRELDPAGKDAALRQMVVIGHSQGGLLTRLQVVDSGNRLWANLSDKPFEQFNLSAEMRPLIQRTAFFKPSPYVKRAVFISTPHHGSFLVGSFAQNLVARLVKMPGEVMKAGTDLVTGNPDSVPVQLRLGMPTAVSNMKPGSPFDKALNAMPFNPDVKLNSIIAVKPGMDIATGNDGVVAYQSAHLEGVESEYVVRFSHSCQDQPLTIEEVRRILLLHAR